MHLLAGEVLLGKSFGAIKSGGDGPVYLRHLDNAFLVWALYGLSPGFCKLLSLLPFKGIQEFMAAGEYVYKVSSVRLVVRTIPGSPYFSMEMTLCKSILTDTAATHLIVPY
jgi:hypothetical protein